MFESTPSASVLLKANRHMALLAGMLVAIQLLDTAWNPAENASEETEQKADQPSACT